MIDFDKNGTNGHQIDQTMGKTECSAKNLNFGILKWPTVTHSGVDELKVVMKSAFRSNKVTHVKRECTSFRDYTEKMVTASG